MFSYTLTVSGVSGGWLVMVRRRSSKAVANEIERGIVSVESICICVFIIGLVTRNAFSVVVLFFVVKALRLELTL